MNRSVLIPDPMWTFLPVTGEVLRWHLSGRDSRGQALVAGIAPMLRDETCFFLAVDFDYEGWGEDAGAFMESCRRLNADAGLVIQIDGPQHLSNVEAYRRDRRKDVLLHEHGYFVVRVLAEDLAKNLDDLLNSILRILARKQRSPEIPPIH